jgi:signal peptidase I
MPQSNNSQEIPPTASGANSGTALEKPASGFSEVVSFLKTLALFLAAAFILRASVVEAFKIPSLSMFPTLKVGDHILVSKLSYGLRLPLVKDSLFLFDSPERGDIVVFTRPDEPHTIDDESSINLIKRVVGLPGETVELRGTQLLIDGKVLDESYARYEEHGIPDGYFGPQRIPEGHVFLLGDNRDHSKDSRFWRDPFLDMRLIKGRALIIYWSWDSLGRIGTVLR